MEKNNERVEERRLVRLASIRFIAFSLLTTGLFVILLSAPRSHFIETNVMPVVLIITGLSTMAALRSFRQISDMGFTLRAGFRYVCLTHACILAAGFFVFQFSFKFVNEQDQFSSGISQVLVIVGGMITIAFLHSFYRLLGQLRLHSVSDPSVTDNVQSSYQTSSPYDSQPNKVTHETNKPLEGFFSSPSYLFVASALFAVFSAIVFYFVQVYIPSEVHAETQVIEEKVSKVSEEATNNQRRVETQISEISSRQEMLEQKLNEIIKRQVNNPRSLQGVLRSTVTSSANELKTTLPAARRLLVAAKERQIVLSPELISEVGLALLNREFRDQEVNKEAWNTISQLASYRTFIDGKRLDTQKVKENPAENKYLEVPVTLNDSNFKDAIFEDCHIIYNSGSLTLSHVRFINCTFDVVEDANGKKLFKALLESNKPNVVIE